MMWVCGGLIDREEIITIIIVIINVPLYKSVTYHHL